MSYKPWNQKQIDQVTDKVYILVIILAFVVLYFNFNVWYPG
jgi:hypothetical protein